MANPLAAVASVELHVTLNLVPRVSSGKTRIWLLAVTAVVFTVTVVAPAAMTTLPACADPHIAGDAALEQFVAVVVGSVGVAQEVCCGLPPSVFRNWPFDPVAVGKFTGLGVPAASATPQMAFPLVFPMYFHSPETPPANPTLVNPPDDRMFISPVANAEMPPAAASILISPLSNTSKSIPPVSAPLPMSISAFPANPAVRVIPLPAGVVAKILFTARLRVVLSHVKFASPPNTPASLY